MKYTDLVFCTEGAEGYSADGAYYDEVALRTLMEAWKPVFESNPTLVHILLDVPIEFELYVGDKDDDDDHVELAWEGEDWRWSGLQINRYGNAWLMFKQKHGDQRMEVKLC